MSVEQRNEIDRLLAEANRIRNVKPELSLEYIHSAKKLAENISDPEQDIRCYISIALTYQGISKFSEALTELNTALELSKKIGSGISESDTYMGLGNVYYYLGDYDNSLKYHLEALRLREKFSDEKKIAFSINSVGVVYATMKNFNLAKEYFRRSLEMNTRLNEVLGIKMAMNNIARVANDQNKPGEAIEWLRKALPGSEQLPNDTLQCELLINLGDACRETKLYDESELHFRQVLDILKNRGNVAEAKALEGMGRLKLATGDLPSARFYCIASLRLYEKLNLKEPLSKIYQVLAEVEKQGGNTAEAFSHTGRFIALMEELHREELVKKTRNLSLAFEAEGLKKENEINYLRNVELKRAYDEINQKNSELIDSIEYARYFQEMVFDPYRKIFSGLFSDSFVLSLPKDIVSGDFFWCTQTGTKFIIILADCTGHGVPGAFVSLVGNSLLNSAVHEKNLGNPAKILGFLNKRFCEMSGSGISNKAGMDITILCIDKEKMEMEYAGAGAGLLIARASGETISYKGNTMLIGSDSLAGFTSEHTRVVGDDTVYLFSDGYHTQKGGAAGKKFLRNPFIELLKSIYREPTGKQKQTLREKFEEWRGAYEQQDDVTVVGFRV